MNERSRKVVPPWSSDGWFGEEVRRRQNSEQLPPEVPLAATVALVGVVALAGLTGIRFAQGAIMAWQSLVSLSLAVPFVIVGALVTGIHLVAVWSLKRGWKWAPVLVALLGIWGASELVSWRDPLAFISAAMAIVAVWMPSTRRHGREVRGARADATV